MCQKHYACSLYPIKVQEALSWNKFMQYNNNASDTYVRSINQNNYNKVASDLGIGSIITVQVLHAQKAKNASDFYIRGNKIT